MAFEKTSGWLRVARTTLSEKSTCSCERPPRRLLLMLRPVGLALRGRRSPFSRGRIAVLIPIGLLSPLQTCQAGGGLVSIEGGRKTGSWKLLNLLTRFSTSLGRGTAAAKREPDRAKHQEKAAGGRSHTTFLATFCAKLTALREGNLSR